MPLEVKKFDMTPCYEDIAEEEIDIVAQLILDMAKEFTPIDTGEMIESYEIEFNGKLFKAIVNRAAHAIFVEISSDIKNYHKWPPRNAWTRYYTWAWAAPLWRATDTIVK